MSGEISTLSRYQIVSRLPSCQFYSTSCTRQWVPNRRATTRPLDHPQNDNQHLFSLVFSSFLSNSYTDTHTHNLNLCFRAPVWAMRAEDASQNRLVPLNTANHDSKGAFIEAVTQDLTDSTRSPGSNLSAGVPGNPSLRGYSKESAGKKGGTLLRVAGASP